MNTGTGLKVALKRGLSAIYYNEKASIIIPMLLRLILNINIIFFTVLYFDYIYFNNLHVDNYFFNLPQIG